MAAIMMEELSVHLMIKVLEYAGVRSRLLLAVCNSTLLHLITQECTELWVHIDLHSFQSERRPKELVSRIGPSPLWISDDALAAFLTRVNARQVTKFLSVGDCGGHSINGSGLEPLRGSQVLERIHLRTGGRTRVSIEECLDEPLVFGILRSMLPYRLVEVRLEKLKKKQPVVSRAAPSPLIAQRSAFFQDMYAADRQRAREQRLPCAGCHHGVVCNESEEEQAQAQAQLQSQPQPLLSLRCILGCLELHCRGASCSVALKDCLKCTRASCEACNVVRQCMKCHSCFCTECTDIYNCMDCNKMLCSTCGDLWTCRVCEKAVCAPCNNLRKLQPRVDPRPILECEECCIRYCHDCKPMAACQRNFCGQSVCTDCNCTTNYCGQCNENFTTCAGGECFPLTCDGCGQTRCDRCDPYQESVITCTNCGANSCPSCGNRQNCQGCDEMTCDLFCTQKLKCCKTCGESFCRYCLENGVCPTCTGPSFYHG